MKSIIYNVLLRILFTNEQFLELYKVLSSLYVQINYIFMSETDLFLYSVVYCTFPSLIFLYWSTSTTEYGH